MVGKLLVANFKMHKTTDEIKEYFAAFPDANRDYPHTVVFCPPFTGLDCARGLIKPPYKLGAQNVHYEVDGAYTGEVSAEMLAEFGVEYVIIGHRERRFYNYEANQILNLKIKAALAHHLKIILCVGEDAEQHAAGKTLAVLQQQIYTTLQGIDDTENIYIAYEPVWAIGSGQAATVKEINEISSTIQQIYHCPVLYGGSVTEHNAQQILQIPHIDGVLVGGACLDPHRFAQICGVVPASSGASQ